MSHVTTEMLRAGKNAHFANYRTQKDTLDQTVREVFLAMEKAKRPRPQKRREDHLAIFLCVIVAALAVMFVGTALVGKGILEERAKLERVEYIVNKAVGYEWPVLTDYESAALAAAVKDLPKQHLIVMFHDELGRPLAESIVDAFKQAGWTDVVCTEGQGLGVGLSTGRGDGMALALKTAIEHMTHFNVSSMGADEKDTGFLFVSVGVKQWQD